MAERATADRVAADMKPPNYRGAVQRLRGIKPKKEKIAGINGEISGIYDTIEGFKVNKKAARIFLTLDPLEEEERADIIRSLTGLIDAAQWPAAGDLVDSALGGNGNIVAADFGRNRAAPRDGENAAGEDRDIADAMDEIDDDVDGVDDGSPEPVADDAAGAGKPKRLSPKEALEKSKKAFAAGKAPDLTKEPEEYTGDNADLAGE